jgi:hypothetical protein
MFRNAKPFRYFRALHSEAKAHNYHSVPVRPKKRRQDEDSLKVQPFIHRTLSAFGQRFALLGHVIYAISLAYRLSLNGVYDCVAGGYVGQCAILRGVLNQRQQPNAPQIIRLRPPGQAARS